MKAKTVAILESRLGSQLAELISKRGGQPLLAPALAEVPDADRDYIAGFVSRLGSAPAKVAIFQTGVGTQALFSATDALGLSETLLGLLAAAVVVARGPKPTSALRSRGVRIDVSAKRDAGCFDRSSMHRHAHDARYQGHRYQGHTGGQSAQAGPVGVRAG